MFRFSYRYKRVALLLLTALTAGSVFSQQDVNRSQDHPLLQRFQNSFIIDYQVTNPLNYQLVLGNMRRVAGRAEPEQVLRLNGILTRITYEISQNFSGGEVFDFFLQQVRDNNYGVLYECQGRECGNSAYWANTVFGNRILYGPEANQHFAAVEVIGLQGKKTYLAIYVTTRTNRRLYAHIEVLEESGLQIEDTLFSQLQENQSIRLTGLTFDAEDQLISQGNLSSIVELLESQSELNIYVVAHLRDEGQIEALLSRSLARATAVRGALIAEGVPGDRIDAHGVGPLAPFCGEGNCQERVDIVIK